jgi:hypothetical protein
MGFGRGRGSAAGRGAGRGSDAGRGRGFVRDAKGTDWDCPSCGNVNWHWRSTCNKCNGAKPAHILVSTIFTSILRTNRGHTVLLVSTYAICLIHTI